MSGNNRRYFITKKQPTVALKPEKINIMTKKTNSLQTLIENRLRATMKCHFKKAFIPSGWACVKIKNFAKELANEIEKFINASD
jgi:hypothetical protein